ncbi:MAG: ATP-binding protein [Actinomycetota bacterium]
MMTAATLDLSMIGEGDGTADLQSTFEEFCERNGVPRKAAMQVMLALEELVVNTKLYGFPEGGDRRVDLHVQVDGRELICDVVDGGIAFDPFTEAPPPDLSNPTAERRVGGLGVHIVKRTMDQVSYQRDGDHNRVRLTKRF